eukprot:1100247-Karenia_brevis.AAC.1
MADGSKSDEDKSREFATRKVVRVIIEQNGGDGARIKKEQKLHANYAKGRVVWNGARVATWDAITK